MDDRHNRPEDINLVFSHECPQTFHREPQELVAKPVTMVAVVPESRLPMWPFSDDTVACVPAS